MTAHGTYCSINYSFLLLLPCYLLNTMLFEIRLKPSDSVVLLTAVSQDT